MRAIDGDRLLRELTTLSHGQVWPGWTYEGIRLLIERQPTLTPPPITGDTSDGYHTFNELYHHRAVLFSVICNARPDIAWKSKKHHDGTMYDGMFIVGIDTPEGQATYHYDIKPYWRMFRVKELEFAPKWDGHTPDEAIRRIGTLTPPNEPLMPDELKEMGGKPVWTVGVSYTDDGKWAMWDIVEKADNEGVDFGYSTESREWWNYNLRDKDGKLLNCAWVCYRRPPEGEEDA